MTRSLKQRRAAWKGGMACRLSDGRIELLAVLEDGPDAGRVVRVRLEQADARAMRDKLTEWTDRPETVELSTAAIDPMERGERPAVPPW